MLVLLAVQEEEWDELDRMIRQFQNACMGLKLAEIPVVVAPFGLTLGGGTEISLHGARVRCAAETYMGLVEVGVGLVPAGGGTKEMALRAHDRCLGVEGADPFPFVKRAFDLIAFAKVSTSGAEALRMFLTPADSLSPNPDRLLGDAKGDRARPRPRRLSPAAAAHRHPRAGPARAGHLQDGHPQRAPRRRTSASTMRWWRRRWPPSSAAATASPGWPASSTSWTWSARPSCRCWARRRPATASSTCSRKASPCGTELTNEPQSHRDTENGIENGKRRERKKWTC